MGALFYCAAVFDFRQAVLQLNAIHTISPQVRCGSNAGRSS
jgi:hypothetical protein